MTEKAIFAAGCFWGVENMFRQLNGVTGTKVGYSGGRKDEPTYREVCSGTTGHAEAVEVEFDSAIVSYQDLVAVFWNLHNPTQLNRQGPDVGSQYRSAIFYIDEEQKKLANESMQEVQSSKKYRRDIVTEILPASTFWTAEEYHQQYFEKHGNVGCHTGY